MPLDPSTLAVLQKEKPGTDIAKSLDQFLAADSYLLECDANERSVSSKFAAYLQGNLSEWHVDCEFNRDGIEPKRIGYLDIHPDQDDTDARTVFPDVIAHRRGTKDNFLVIEIKKATSRVPREVDLSKLRGYKRDLGYVHALFLEFSVGEKPGISRVEWLE